MSAFTMYDNVLGHTNNVLPHYILNADMYLSMQDLEEYIAMYSSVTFCDVHFQFSPKLNEYLCQ